LLFTDCWRLNLISKLTLEVEIILTLYRKQIEEEFENTKGVFRIRNW
jgi:hypothetical protein